VGDVKVFKDGNFFLVRLRDGFLALTRWCTHMNGRLVYQRAHWRFWCPYHGAIFDRRGEPIGDRADVCPLRRNPIQLSPDGHLLVDTDQVLERESYAPDQALRPPDHEPTAKPDGSPPRQASAGPDRQATARG
jgi:Rieske Fe-S protein